MSVSWHSLSKEDPSINEMVAEFNKLNVAEKKNKLFGNRSRYNFPIEQINIDDDQLVDAAETMGCTFEGLELKKWVLEPMADGEDKQNVIVKTFKTSEGSSGTKRKAEKMFEREVAIVEKLNLGGMMVGVVGKDIREGQNKKIIYENYHYTIYDIIQKKEYVLDTTQKLQIAIEIAKTGTYIHSQGVCVRNFSIKNVVISFSGQIQLTNLSTAKSLDSDEQMTIMVGNPGAISPQAMDEDEDAPVDPVKNDLFGFGALIFELFEEREIFGKYLKIGRIGCVNQLIKDNARPPFSDKTPHAVRKIVMCLWSANESDRPPNFLSVLEYLLNIKNL